MEMIEEEMLIKEPINLKRNLIIIWALIGIYVFYKDFKKFYNKMAIP
jgi:hypothetical protein